MIVGRRLVLFARTDEEWTALKAAAEAYNLKQAQGTKAVLDEAERTVTLVDGEAEV